MNATPLDQNTDVAALAEWFDEARRVYASAVVPVEEDDPRAQVLADLGRPLPARALDPKTLAVYYWEYVAAPTLPLPPFAWPSWADSFAMDTEAWGGGVVEVAVHGHDSIDGAAVLYQQRFQFDPKAETVSPQRIAARITTPDEDDEIWVDREHLAAILAAARKALEALGEAA